jgi:hypothetical protein
MGECTFKEDLKEARRNILKGRGHFAIDCDAVRRTIAMVKRTARLKIHLHFIPLFKRFFNSAM